MSTPKPTLEVRPNEDPHSAWQQLSGRGAVHVGHTTAALGERWRNETGSARNTNTTQILFMMIVMKAMLQDVQQCLDNVVGLMGMDWPLLSGHTVHHVNNCGEEKQEAEAQVPENPTPQAPVMFQPPPQPLAPPGPVQAAPVNFPATTLPPIHVHIGSSNGNYQHWKGSVDPRNVVGNPVGEEDKALPHSRTDEHSPTPI